MKRSILMFLVMLVTIIYFGCSEDSPMTPGSDQSDLASTRLKGTKPAPNLIGEMDLYFDLLAVPPGDPVWVGTVAFEDYGVYGMRFYHLSPFRDYSQVSPFEEYFEIYDLDDGTVVLGGPDVGVTILANKPPDPTKYVMNGEIDVAAEPFEDWLGRNVHMNGIITWQFVTLPDGTVIGPVPETAPGTIRLN
jgi:hypothetical protein